MNHFQLIVVKRIDDHKAAEEQRLAAERERIAEEERLKAEARAKSEMEATVARTQAMMETHQQNRTEQAQPAPAAPANVVPMELHAPTLRLGQISDRLGFTVTADFLTSIGFPPAATEKSSKLYHDADFTRICDAIAQHVMAAAQQFKEAA